MSNAGPLSVNGLKLVALGSDDPAEMGQNSSLWEKAMDQFPSREKYIKVSNDFVSHSIPLRSHMTPQQCAIEYNNITVSVTSIITISIESMQF